MLRFGTSVSYGEADTLRPDQWAGADPARTRAQQGSDAGSKPWGRARTRRPAGRGASPRTAPMCSQPGHRGRKLQIGITSISRKEPLRGAKSSASTSLNHNLPCLGGVQKLLAARSDQTPPSTPGYCSTGHDVPAVLVSHSLLGAQNKTTCVPPPVLKTSRSSRSARRTWTGMEGKGLLTPADWCSLSQAKAMRRLS